MFARKLDLFMIWLLSLRYHTIVFGTTVTGDGIVWPGRQGTKVTYFAYDVKQDNRLGELSETYANELYSVEKFNGLRLPLRGPYHPEWSGYNYPTCPWIGHPEPGNISAEAYACNARDITTARAVNPDVQLFASLKMAYYNGTFYPPFPDWAMYNDTDIETGEWDGEKATQTITSKYATMLADFLDYFENVLGIVHQYLGLENETGYISPQVFVDTMAALIEMAAERGFTVPLIVVPDLYTPKPSWYSDVIKLGGEKYIHVAGTHYYGSERETLKNGQRTTQNKLIQWHAAAPAGVPRWHTEVHWSKVSDMQNQYEEFDLPRHADEVNELDCVENLLLQFVDFEYVNMSGYVWWSYKNDGDDVDDSKQHHAMYEVTDALAMATPVFIDDFDGRYDHRTFQLRTWNSSNKASSPLFLFAIRRFVFTMIEASSLLVSSF
ncbi:hypothetical protein CYMTET_30128 [Cymbomonas tetramitiformis]|uniref:Uncharacterized protein n=1 Tax=Cymbomonas tetramitiformis TaxID=36881 RepID=A0AAE0FIC6_9CHLO|nr:hypothetical protein CYMTET_30730 [Cymbomonas tetramitiformis]KAK3260943.1 hypothetical protein CYMTET_30128 [Cymbomonas tetramitiformis]